MRFLAHQMTFCRKTELQGAWERKMIFNYFAAIMVVGMVAASVRQGRKVLSLA